MSLDQYQQVLLIDLDSVNDDRFAALSKIELAKIKRVRAYNKHVNPKQFVEGHLVWKTILPIGVKDPNFDKWSSNWKGSFIVTKVYKGGAYQSTHIDGEELSRKINGKYLKIYNPTIWEGIHN